MKTISHRTIRDEAGQSLVELALLIPFVFLLIVNAVNFAGFFFAWITVTNAARVGAQYMAAGGATLGAPAPATSAQVTALITNEISSLPNRDSLQVGLCTNRNGVTSCSGAYSSTPPADPESAYYVLASVDVTYTYVPFLAAWDFPALGIHLTLPPTAVHQRSTQRMLQ